MTACPHCGHALAGETRCPACGADMVPAEPGGPLALESRSLWLWALVVLPGVACLLAAFTFGVTWLGVIGGVLVVVPLVVQLFGADWTSSRGAQGPRD